MNKKIIFSILILLLSWPPFSIRADYSASINYLLSQRPNHWISQALAAQGQSNLDFSYLDDQTTDLMTAIKSLLVAGASQEEGLNGLDHWRQIVYSAFDGEQLGSVDLLNDDFWGSLALAAVNKSENLSTIQKLGDFILSQQNSDGGWGWATGGDSDSNDTAAAIMALLESNQTPNAPAVSAAINYLRSCQNNDGGFAYAPGSQSDGASTAWVLAALNKLNQSREQWTVGDRHPLSFLESLGREDGSFAWLPDDAQGSSLVTAYALVALSGKYYPVNYLTLVDEEPAENGVSLRIEGPTKTLCLANNLRGTNVLEILVAGSQTCGYDYVIEQTAFGPYVAGISGINGQGLEGWQYWVNWQAGQIAADQQAVTDGDEVLWAYGGWPLWPTRLEVAEVSADVGESVLVSLQYYDGANWQAWSQAEFRANNQSYYSDLFGLFNLYLDNDGIYTIWAPGDASHVRSNKHYLSVGQGQNQSVSLRVNITESGQPSADSVAFSVNKSSLDFSDLRPGQSGQTDLVLSNDGSVELIVEAAVTGDQVFNHHLDLNDLSWPDYALNLVGGQDSSVLVSLGLPADYPERGLKTGQLIFWAQAR